jgi:hypothetical protein
VLLAAWMGNANGGYFVDEWGISAAVAVALSLFVSVVGIFDGARLRWGFAALALFSLYAAWTLASLLWSANKGDAWLGAGQTLFYLLVMWAAMTLVALGASRRWVLAASVLGPAAVALFTLLGVQELYDQLFENHRLVGTVGYYNGQAAFLLVPLWVAVYLSGSPRLNPALRGAVLAGAVLCVCLAVLAQSRGAMVAMAVSAPVYFLLSGQRMRGLIALLPIAGALYVAFPGLNAVYLASSQGEDPAAALERVLPVVWVLAGQAGIYGLCWGLLDGRWRPSRALVLGTGAVVCALGVGVLFYGSAVERVGDPVAAAQQKWQAFDTNDATGEDQSRYLSASGSGRTSLWEVAWRDFAAHPVLGVGTQNYEATYYQLREGNAGFVRQPHSLPLEVLAERGAVGGLLFFGGLAVCLGVGLRRRFGGLSSEGKAQVGALVAATTYWFVHSSAEWFWQLPAVTLPAMVYLGLLVAPWHHRRPDGTASVRFEGWVVRVGGVAIAALTIAVVAPLWMADRHLERADALDDPAAALTEVERAQRYYPLDSRLHGREAELATDAGDWERAEEAYGRAIALNPEHYAPQTDLAHFYERRGEMEEALIHYRKASALNPLDEELRRRAE